MSDIAARLGIHPSTVSLALKDSPKISGTTRARVQSTAVEMGYRVNPFVSALMSSRRRGDLPRDTPVVALVTAGDKPDRSAYGHNVQQFVDGCERAARNLGFEIERFWIGDPAMTAERLNQTFCDAGVRGAILLSSGARREKLHHRWCDVAVVWYGILESASRYDWVQANHSGNMERLLAILRGEGFQRIGFAMDTPYRHANLNPWLAVYLLEQMQRPAAQRLNPWLDAEPTFEGFQTWLEAEQPEAVICVRPPKVLGWLEQLGLRVPEDVSVATLGTATMGGTISGIVENAAVSSRFAYAILMDRMHGSDFGPQETPQHISVSGQWNRGETVRYR